MLIVHGSGRTPGNIIGKTSKILVNRRGFFCDFYSELMEIICLKAPGASFLVLSLFDLLMGEPENPHFYDFGIFERVTKPQNQHYLSLETPGHLKKIKENP